MGAVGRPGALRIAALLLILSGITHLLQLLVYGWAGHVIAAAAFGAVYLVLGVGVLRKRPWGLLGASVLPLVGGVLGVYRFCFLQANPFSFFHVAIDLVVVPIVAREVLSARAKRAGPSPPRQ